MLRAALILTVAVLAVPAVASADDWAIAPQSPAPNATIPATSSRDLQPFTFAFTATPLVGIGTGSASVVIQAADAATQANYPLGGTIPVDSLTVFNTTTDPTTFRGQSLGAWRYTPGTYIWSAHVQGVQVPPATGLLNASSATFTFTIAASAATPKVPATVCAAYPGQIRALTSRINNVQAAYDRAVRPAFRRTLRKRLASLKRQRAAVGQRAARDCGST